MSDNITLAERTLAEHFGDETAAEVVAALAGAGLEVRARVAGTDGPDQGDPAAWALVVANGRLGAATTDPGLADSWRSRPWRDDNGRLRPRESTVVPLYRAPGAAAAGPTVAERQPFRLTDEQVAAERQRRRDEADRITRETRQRLADEEQDR